MIALIFFIGCAIAFDFGQYFEGEWAVMTESVESTYTIKKQDDGSLVGTISGADGETTSHLKVDFADGVTEGSLMLSAGEATWHKLFAFAFEGLPNGVQQSRGKWNPLKGGAAGTYQFTVVSPKAFVLTVQLADGTQVVTSAAKVVAEPEQSFVQKYGMMVFMMLFMVGTQYMKYKMNAATAGTAKGGATVQTAPKTKKQ